MPKKTPVITTEQLAATNSAYKLREGSKNDDQLAEQLGISKVTLYTRLEFNNWKKPEIELIKLLIKPEEKLAAPVGNQLLIQHLEQFTKYINVKYLRWNSFVPEEIVAEYLLEP